MPDLTEIHDREILRKLVGDVYGGSKNVVANLTGQLWTLRTRIQVGDFMVLPIRSTSQIAIGEVIGGYKYLKNQEDPSRRHVIQVKWLKTDISKALLKQDLVYQLGSALTIFEVGNNDAAYRLEKVLNGVPDPGARAEGASASANSSPNLADDIESPVVDLEEIAADGVAKRLQEDFKGHDLSLLVEAILTSEGFVCRNSPPGADGGVDILAGTGTLGMDAPRLVVQVKSQTSAVSDTVLQQLNGAIHRFQADQALLVTFGGVTSQARAYLDTQYFKIRVWTMSDIVKFVHKHYPSFDESIQRRLRLKQIWIPLNQETE